MNLNCLTCQGKKRTDSDTDMRQQRVCEEKLNINKLLDRVERSWSGNLVPRPTNFDKMRKASNLATAKKFKKSPRRMHNSGPLVLEGTGSPRLIRSSGMRRDWSFEDLRQRNALKS